MRLRTTLTRWLSKLQRRRLARRLSRIEVQRHRIESLPADADRRELQSRLGELEALCVERSRMRYLISVIDEDRDAPSASSTYRRQERAVLTNSSSGHSPRFRSNLPNATHR